MDDQRFDTWAKSFAGIGSRRRILGGLAGVGAAALLGAFRRDASDVEAHHGRSGPGDPCRDDNQCFGADAPLVCAWNGFDYDGDLNCCTYEGNRCGFDGACCGLATCVNGFCSSDGSSFSSAGSGGIATSSADGGTVFVGDVNSGGNRGNTIDIGNTSGPVQVSGGTVTNDTNLNVSADGGTAISDASGGSGNIAGAGGGGYYDDNGNYWNSPDYSAGPGDPCQYTGQCTNSQSFLTCDYNAYTDDYRCCGYEGDRCSWDGGCCGWLSCNGYGYCVS